MRKLTGTHYVSILASLMMLFLSAIVIIEPTMQFGYKIISAGFIVVIFYIYFLIGGKHVSNNYVWENRRLRRLTKKEKRERRRKK
jgi:hypothetical protein